MTPVDLTKLPDFLKNQRWFGGKAAPIKSVEVVDHVTVDSPPACSFSLAIVQVVYTLGTPERYLLPVKPASGDRIEEALDDEACLGVILQLIREQRELPSTAGHLRGEWLDTEESQVELSSPPRARRLAVEQSNTSVVFDDKVILKVIRKLEAGVTPEYEVGRFLAMKTRFRATPTLLGALNLEGPASATLALVHRFVPDAQDGWRYTLEAFRQAPTPDAEFLERIRELGRCVGELHVALASDPSDPAFAPEPLQAEDAQRWSASIVGELGVTLVDAVKVVPELEERREALIELARKLAQVTPSGQKIRIHGDLHLGQTLRSGGQWLLIDFEGEPARSFAQRREKYSPLRDVAGMLRSFDYADATVRIEGAPEGQRVQPSRDAFLAGYLEVTRGAAFLPADEAAFNAALRALELEKVLYEVRYEVANRPDWVRIPVQALLRMEEPK